MAQPAGSARGAFTALDYVKELRHHDFDWFTKCWQRYVGEQRLPGNDLFAALGERADDEIDEAAYVDRLHNALMQGNILVMIVGDGIETRLQQLVAHSVS